MLNKRNLLTHLIYIREGISLYIYVYIWYPSLNILNEGTLVVMPEELRCYYVNNIYTNHLDIYKIRFCPLQTNQNTMVASMCSVLFFNKNKYIDLVHGNNSTFIFKNWMQFIVKTYMCIKIGKIKEKQKESRSQYKFWTLLYFFSSSAFFFFTILKLQHQISRNLPQPFRVDKRGNNVCFCWTEMSS